MVVDIPFEPGMNIWVIKDDIVVSGIVKTVEVLIFSKEKTKITYTIISLKNGILDYSPHNSILAKTKKEAVSMWLKAQEFTM